MIILITLLMVTGIVYGGGPSDIQGVAAPAGLGWQEQTRRVSVFVCDGLRLTTGPVLNTTGFTLTFGISSNFSVIECCRLTTLRQSWCNFNADDPRCAD